MPAAKGDFRQHLQDIFESRVSRNPSYSLRSFSRALDIESSTLSQILRGKRRVTQGIVEKLAPKLGISGEELAGYVNRVRLSQLKHLDDSKLNDQPYQEYGNDKVELASDWYDYAIIELSHVEGFQADAAWIAKRLGLKANIIELALKRLEKAGLLARDVEGRWTKFSPSASYIPAGDTSEARRNMQRQMLSLAMDALDQTAYDRRDQTSMTMAINPERMEEARDYIRKFRRGLTRFLEDDPQRTDVYHLCISLYPVTKPLPKEAHSPC